MPNAKRHHAHVSLHILKVKVACVCNQAESSPQHMFILHFRPKKRGSHHRSHHTHKKRPSSGLEKGKKERKKKVDSPRRGIEPRSPA